MLVCAFRILIVYFIKNTDIVFLEMDQFSSTLTVHLPSVSQLSAGTVLTFVNVFVQISYSFDSGT